VIHATGNSFTYDGQLVMLENLKLAFVINETDYK